MKRFLFASTAIVAVAASFSHASPTINGAVIIERVFNEMPGTTLTTVNAYPHININEVIPAIPNGTNWHSWRASADGGATAAQFLNGDSFQLSADVTVTGTANGEAGLNVSPWWSPNVDGQFHIRPSDGEVAAFGGRLPFFSFTNAFGSHYVLGTTVHMGITYTANDTSSTFPAQIQYEYNGLFSPWINFDQGNAAEDPPHGQWGALNPFTIGGYMQDSGQLANTFLNADFNNIVYGPTPAPGAVGLLGLGGLLAARRRR